MSANEITRQDLSISQARAEAARTAHGKRARRILAIAMVLNEHPRLLAVQAAGMDRQRLRDLCIAPTPPAWRGSRTGPGLGVSRVWPKPN